MTMSAASCYVGRDLTYPIRCIASLTRTTSGLTLPLQLLQHSHENHKAQLAAQRDSEQTLMKTFKQKETGRRKSVHSLMSRVNQRRSNLTGGDYTPGAYYCSAVLLDWCGNMLPELLFCVRVEVELKSSVNLH
jgi:hypothetical protein